MNLGLAPRAPRCPVCKAVQMPEDVTMRLFAADGTRLGLVGARDYMRSVGMPGSDAQLTKQAIRHRRHIEVWMRAGAPDVSAPVLVDEGISRVPAPTGPTFWVDANQAGIDAGMDALRILADRVRIGDMEDADLIAVAKLGQTAAAKRGDLEARGRQLRQVDGILRLAAGIAKPAESTA